jgi:anaerobic magnesium-protoporphyrin IX monomethyl ester cyclase
MNTIMVDIVFITSTDSKKIHLSVYPYLGIGYLSAELIKSGYSVKIYDVDAENLNYDKILKKLSIDTPKYIGLTVMSRSLPFIYKILSRIKARFQNTIIILGGAHLTSDPYIVKEMKVDYGLQGDSEYSFLELINCLNTNTDFNKIPGLVYFGNDKEIINKKEVLDRLDSSIIHAYPLYNFDLYADIVFPGVRSFTMDTSRGCPYNCSFCSNHSKTKVRFYCINNIIEQLSVLVNKYNIKWIAFVDDLFTFKKDRIIELCNKIIEMKLTFNWSCLTRVDWLDEDLLIHMKQAGLYNIIFGVESGSEQIRKSDNKSITNDQYYKAIKICRKLGIKTLNTFIIGHPEETYKQMFETIFYSIKLNSNLVHYQLMSPLPSSPIFEKAVAENVFNSNVWTLFMQGIIKEPYYYPKGKSVFIVKIIHLSAYVLFYLMPQKFFLIISKVIRLLIYKIKAKQK